MRTPLIAGNWKMFPDLARARALAQGLLARAPGSGAVEVGVFPPFVQIPLVVQILRDSGVLVGAQDCHHERQGAFTGCVSAWMLAEVGATHVIVGHSERREHCGEDDALVRRKATAALEAGLTPIVCVGERLEQRDAGRAIEVVEAQVRAALDGLSEADAHRVIVAYEPVWAIGTGRTATAAQAAEVHGAIRAVVARAFGRGCADRMRILYGGSVKPSNAEELLREPDIDGALVGGASLEVADFAGIVDAATVHPSRS